MHQGEYAILGYHNFEMITSPLVYTSYPKIISKIVIFFILCYSKTMKKLTGVFEAKKKNGQLYFRSSITCKGRHISLGSFDFAEDAHAAYLEADRILHDPSIYQIDLLETYFSHVEKNTQKRKKSFAKIDFLTFEKVVILLNFRDNNIYFHSPIYLYKHFFHYYLEAGYHLTFDKEDLFYYSSHKIMRRGNHLFVADYGMQVTITGRYGIRNFAVKDRDYRFINQDDTDFRYSNIEIINPYHGVLREGPFGNYTYRVLIHIKGNYTIGIYDNVETAAIAYNKAADLCHQYGIEKKFPVNYIETMSPKTYAEIYSDVNISESFLNMLISGCSQ